MQNSDKHAEVEMNQPLVNFTLLKRDKHGALRLD